MTPEQVKQVEEIRKQEKLAFYSGKPGEGNQFMRARDAAVTLIAIVDDLQKQLNSAILIGQAAVSLTKEQE